MYAHQDNKIWLRTAVEHFKPGILRWVVGDHSAETFEPLWELVKQWQCYFYVTDGWKVYPGFIPDGDQIVSKTYMTRVEGENSRLRHCALERTDIALAMANRHMSIRHCIEKAGRPRADERRKGMLPKTLSVTLNQK